MADTFTNLLYHIVFSTKHRQPLIDPVLQQELYAYIGGIIRAEKGTLIEIGGTTDHVHIVARFCTEPSVATMVKTIKAKSSKWVNELPSQPVRFEWQAGYSAFTLSESQLPKVVQYVRGQEEHHRRTTFQEEFIALLKRNRIEYDERYLWD